MPRNIIATVFGGAGENECSAYDKHRIGDDELAVALPYRFDKDKRPRVKVTNTANGKSVVCTVEDVGPWFENDPYWKYGTRPKAESGKDLRGRKTNHAGIDLSPAAAKAIGIDGDGVVEWQFV